MTNSSNPYSPNPLPRSRVERLRLCQLHPQPSAVSGNGEVYSGQESSDRSPRAPSAGGRLVSILVGVLLLSGVGVLGSLSQGWQADTTRQYSGCTTTPNYNQALSRETVVKMLSIAERESATTVQEVLSEPYCRLPSVEIRAGVQAERSLYALDFDAQTWLVVLYEEEEYAGYAFDVTP